MSFQAFPRKDYHIEKVIAKKASEGLNLSAETIAWDKVETITEAILKKQLSTEQQQHSLCSLDFRFICDNRFCTKTVLAERILNAVNDSKNVSELNLQVLKANL